MKKHEHNRKRRFGSRGFLAFMQCCLLTLSTGVVHGAEIHVPEDHDTIQGAVDAALDGDTIHISPGVYAEQVSVIGKNLALRGRPGTILRAFPGMEAAGSSPVRAVVFVYESELVTLRELTFEGEQLANEPGSQFVGAFFRRSGAIITNCQFTGFREKTPGTASAAAIRVDTAPGTGGGEFEVTIRDNLIVDSYVGMGVRAQGSSATFDLLIENNVIRGVGPNSMGGQWGMRGIDLGDGVSGLVVGNVISDFPILRAIPSLGFHWPGGSLVWSTVNRHLKRL